MNPYTERVEDVLLSLRVQRKRGLSQGEVKRRQQEHGRNELPREKGFQVVTLFLERFKDVLMIILIIAAVLSVVLGRLEDAILISFVILLDATLSFVQVWRAERTLEKLREQVPDLVSVLRDERWQTLRVTELVPGDVVELKAGERVPADGRLIKAEGLSVQEAILTGESSDVAKHTRSIRAKKPISERANMVFAGTTIAGGSGISVVTDTGLTTEFGKIAQVLSGEKSPPSPLRTKLQRQGMIIGWVIIAAVLILSAIGLLKGDDPAETARTAITLVVSAIPEDLTVILTIALTVGVMRILRQKGVVRRLNAGETLGAATVICTDKTGTLTEGKMTATSFNFLQGDILFPQSSQPEDMWLKLGVTSLALATGAHRRSDNANNDGYVGSATERVALKFAEEMGFSQTDLRSRWRGRDTIPFDSKWKYRAQLAAHPTQAEGVIMATGAPDVLLERSSRALTGGREAKALSGQRRRELTDKLHELAQAGNRLLGVAVKRHVEKDSIDHNDIHDLVFLGAMTIEDPVRDEVKNAMKETQDAGVDVKVITGDLQETALAVARQAGLTAPEDTLITGNEISDMSDDELKERIDSLRILSRVEPLDKQRIVRALRARGHVVAMTGDGVNDAVALKSADIGVAMGSGTDLAKDSADLILLDDSFATIVAAIKEGRVIRDNIRKVVAFLLSTNAAEVAIFFVSLLLALPLPLLPAQILWINLVTDGTSDIALALEPPERNVMKRKPENPNNPLLSRRIYGHMGFSGLVLTAGTMGLYWYLLKMQGADLEYARTMAFVFLAVASLLSVWSFRSLTETMFRRGFTQNKWILLSGGGSFLLQLAAVYVPSFQSFFDTVSLHTRDWVIIVTLALLTTILTDWRKLLWPLTSK